MTQHNTIQHNTTQTQRNASQRITTQYLVDLCAGQLAISAPARLAVATTAAGHVLATSDERVGRSYQGKLVKFDGASGAKLWDTTYDSVSYLYGVEGDAADEVAYVTGKVEVRSARTEPAAAAVRRRLRCGCASAAAPRLLRRGRGGLRGGGLRARRC